MKRYRGGKRLRKSAERITAPKWTVIGLCAALVLPLAGNSVVPMAFAAEDSTGLCPHHKSHDESCGWQPAKKGSSNAHVHDESSGYAALEVGTPSNVEDNAGGSAEALCHKWRCVLCRHREESSKNYDTIAKNNPVNPQENRLN